MSGFAVDSESDIDAEVVNDSLGALNLSGVVQLNTDFTPVKDVQLTADFHQPVSGVTSPAFSYSHEGSGLAAIFNQQRRGSVRRASINNGPSEELLRTTAARVNDSQALDEKHRARSPSYLRVSELPEESQLLRTTEARKIDTQILEEQRKSPTRGFKIVDEDFQVKSSLLRTTEAQRNYIKALEEHKHARQASPEPIRLPSSDFQPSARLLKTTKKTEADRLALEEKKYGRRPVDDGKPKNVVPKNYTPSQHLAKPTQSSIVAANQWEDIKRQKREAKDIWWEERKPAEKAKSRSNTPSKLRSPTKAYLFSRKEKVPISQSIFATPEEAIAAAGTTSIPSTAPISDTSHLLKTTRAATMGQVGADPALIAPELQPQQRGLELVSRQSFRGQPVESKLFHETMAVKASKFGACLEPEPEPSPTKMVVHSPSERLTALNESLQNFVRAKAEIAHDPREEGWNSFTDKDHTYPSPANRPRRTLPRRNSGSPSNNSSQRKLRVNNEDDEDYFPGSHYNSAEHQGDEDDETKNESAVPATPPSASKVLPPAPPNSRFLPPPAGASQHFSAAFLASPAGKSPPKGVVVVPKLALSPSPATPQQAKTPLGSKKSSSSSLTPATSGSARKTQKTPVTSSAKGVAKVSSGVKPVTPSTGTKPKPRAQAVAEATKKAVNAIRNDDSYKASSSPAASPVVPKKEVVEQVESTEATEEEKHHSRDTTVTAEEAAVTTA